MGLRSIFVEIHTGCFCQCFQGSGRLVGKVAFKILDFLVGGEVLVTAYKSIYGILNVMIFRSLRIAISYYEEQKLGYKLKNVLYQFFFKYFQRNFYLYCFIFIH